MQNFEVHARMSPGEIATIAYSQRKKALVAFVTPVVLAILVVLFLPPLYRAEVDIVVKTGREFLAQGENETTPTAPQSTKEEDINSEIELLGSRAMAVDAIDAIGLKNLFPDLVSSPPWFGTVMDHAVKSFQRHLDVEPVKLSNVISITYDADSPRQAEQVLDKFIAAYQALHAQVFSTGKESAYKSSLTDFLGNMDQLERRRTRIKLDNRIYDIDAQRAALINQRVEAQSKLQDTISRKATLDQSIAYLTRKRAEVPSMLPSGEMEHANAALADLQQSETEMAVRDGDSNPELQRVRQQIDDLQQKMGALKGEMSRFSASPSPLAQEIDEQIVADRAEQVPLLDELVRDRALVASLDSELHRLEQADLELRTIETRIGAMNSVLEAVQSRYSRARSEEELDRARQVSVVPEAKAVAPDKPVVPRPLLYTAAGVLAGILFAGGVIVFGIVTSRRFITEQSVERLIGLPVLAAIPHLENPHHPTPALPGPL
ncbi:MAG TPA: hypothetical protein VNX86_03295 [Rhizomicrobium sp.]|jgi:succinoglycan biosynthesis transport protein ExoP|nr:hypothetical protein [Rhizomicrobium sp.]